MTLLETPRLPDIAPASRVAVAVPCIAVVDSLSGKPIAASLAAALSAMGRRVVRTRLLVRKKVGFDLSDGGAAAHPDALLAATRALLASLPPHDVLIAEGAPLLAALSVRFAILATSSPSLVTLEPDVRALRDRFDLVLYDARPRVLDRLAPALAA